jgi:basic membrane lipoprotein Med (substrate-binding protein (PBP1-ABC) superfamily)
MDMLRSTILKAAAMVVAMCVLFGCGRIQKKEQLKVLSEDNGQVLSVFAIFPTPVEEPWAGAVHMGFLKAQEEGLIVYSFEENTGYAHFDSILHANCSKGFDIVAGDAFGSESTVRKLAAEFQETVFFFGSGEGPNATNLSVFDDLVHEPAYLAGMAVGAVTRTSRIGIVAAMPIPEINRLTNAFIAGAHETDPEAVFEIAYIDEFYNPLKADS